MEWSRQVVLTTGEIFLS